jgi:hypothetical protein
MHQKRSIPCQQRSILLYHCGEQALVVGVILVTDVKAKQPQFSNEFAEVPVGYEGVNVTFLQPKRGNRFS